MGVKTSLKLENSAAPGAGKWDLSTWPTREFSDLHHEPGRRLVVALSKALSGAARPCGT